MLNRDRKPRLLQPAGAPTNPRRLRQLAAILARDAALYRCEQTLGVWKKMPERDLWTVLASCILGSQVSHPQMQATIANLKADGLAEPWRIQSGNDGLKARIRSSLSGKSVQAPDFKRAAYRFPSRGAALLSDAVRVLYGNGGCIRELIAGSLASLDLRRLLVASVPGIGPKQASLFLLEIGVSNDFCALDRHVMRYVAITRAIDGDSWRGMPQNIGMYERLEDELRGEAHGLGVSLASLDLALWILMRTWSSERTYSQS